MTRPVRTGSSDDESARVPELREAMVSDEGLRRVSRLTTIGELAMCFWHEVHNPLTIILGGAKVMQDSLSKEDPHQASLDAIVRNGLRLRGMADSILSFGRERAKRAEFWAPETLIQEAVCFVAPYFTDVSKTAIVADIDVENGCRRVAVDRWEMINVLVNLLKNSVDAMAQSDERRIAISAKTAGPRLIRIDVSDTGCGFDSQNVSRVFTPFFTTKGERGNGLGLYIVRNTIEAHGGTVSMRTGPGGTTFTLCLPSD